MPIREFSVEDLTAAIAGDDPPVLLDVRTEAEHAIARLEPSTLLPLHELQARLDEIAPWKDRPVVVYCHHGVRSKSGAAILTAAGFGDVVSLRGGIDAWSSRIDPRVPRY